MSQGVELCSRCSQKLLSRRCMQISTVAFIFKESDLNSADLCVGAAGRYQRGKDWSEMFGETLVRNLPYVMSAGINKSPAANLAHFIIKNQSFLCRNFISGHSLLLLLLV